ncbi:hypothetical protein EXIGLDRAFT_635957 [Exidia glandulosa HHB12029]|uniref:Protein kinase domain-containing protein n=1 Tax=Exidia glandulosa HHB12029 TaxID=1314781 RepID=A0A165R2J7_EXIGL|nr:hypothetical protein EXIGLDRAFT_635957 [Exidia glandulosa HHB12029]
MQSLPRSFSEIIKACYLPESHPRTVVWQLFESFFASHGLQLWNVLPDELRATVPPDTRSRAPDPFFYRFAAEMDRTDPFTVTTPTLCAARTVDGRDVVISIVAIGKEGTNHLEALRRLATGNVASVIGNHTVPVLQWLTLEHITFAVHPYLSSTDPTTRYFYENTGDLLRHLLQMLEAVAFCHSKLVAHRDVFEQNFLCNFGGRLGPNWSADPPPPGQPMRPFRSLFPFMLYLIDFEWAVCFDPGSDPATHVVKGRPLNVEAYAIPVEYDRPVAPEMDYQEPHNPFMADVWQLGTYFKDVAKTNRMPRAALEMIEGMTATLPADRPTAHSALLCMRKILSDLSNDELKAQVWIRPIPRSPRAEAAA